MVILAGPRQVGKTTFSQLLMQEQAGAQYLNYDILAHREILRHQNWNKETPLLVFDEIHKMSDWKAWLKGAFDGRSLQLATCSACGQWQRNRPSATTARYRQRQNGHLQASG